MLAGPACHCVMQYLCNGLEEDMTARKAAITGTISERELLIKASGKMVLLDKLLPKLRAEGKKVRMAVSVRVCDDQQR